MTQWYETRIADESDPIGRRFKQGEAVHVRPVHGDVWALIGHGERRMVTGQQLRDFTTVNKEPLKHAPNPEVVQAKWEAMDPPHAGELEPGIPRFYKGMKVEIAESTARVKEPLWQLDNGNYPTPRGVISIERRVLDQINQNPQTGKPYLAQALDHEAYENEDAYEKAAGLHPYAHPADIARVADEIRGLAHADTITAIDQFQGSAREQDYYRQNKKDMEALGFGKAVKEWPDGPTLNDGEADDLA